MYYILRSDGSSIFTQSYGYEFIFHCLMYLLDIAPNESFTLCQIDLNGNCHISLFSLKSIGGERVRPQAS